MLSSISVSCIRWPWREAELREGDGVVCEGGEAGTRNAQCNLGGMYENGHGVKQSYEKAMEWYAKAAKQGDAMLSQSRCHVSEWPWREAELREGDGVVCEGGEAGTRRCSVQSRCHVSEWPWREAELREGDGVVCEGGEAGTRCSVQSRFHVSKGHNVKQSYEKAMEWYAKAAKQGDADAQCKLGVM